MASDHVQVPEQMDEADEPQFISAEDILAEIPDDGDETMREDDQQLGEGDQVVTVDVDTSILHFPGHAGCVFAVSAHPIAPLAVSGGEDDLGYIWNVTDGQVVAKLTGHTDSVTSVAFSVDGELVASGGMDGKIRIWRRVGGEGYNNWEFMTELTGPDEVMWLRWHSKGTVLLAGSNDSTVWLWQLPSGNTMQVFAGHTGPVNCGEFTPDGKRIVSGCGDNTLVYWDPRTPTPVFKLTAESARFDLGGITSLAVNPSSTLTVVGGANGGVRVVSLSKGDVVGTLSGHKEGESIETVQFVDISGVGQGGGSGAVVTGGTDGKICVWDLNTMRLRTKFEHQDAITTLLVHPAPQAHLITSASADKTLCTWDARKATLVREHKGHREPVLGAALGLGGAVVVSAGDDGVCLVFSFEPDEE